MKKIGLLILSLVLIAGLSSTSTMAAGGAYLNVATSPNTPGSRDVLVGTTDEVTLKAILTTSVPELKINNLRVDVFRYYGNNDTSAPAQYSDVANVYLSANATRLTTKKNFDSPWSYSITFKPEDWMTSLTVPTGNGTELSVVLDIPSSSNTSGLGLFVAIDGKNIVAPCPVFGSANGTIMAIKESGYISLSLPPDTPQSAIIAVGETGVNNVTLAKIDVFAGRESVAIQSLGIANMAKAIRDTDIKAISLWDGNTQLGTKQALVNANETWFNFPPDSPWIIPADTHKILTIKADLNGVATTNVAGVVSGDTVALALDPNVKAVGLASGKILPGAPNWIFGNTMVLRKSKPVIAAASLPSTVLSAGEKVLYRWTITADAKGDISWRSIIFDVAGSIQVGAENFIIGSKTEIPALTDAVYMQSSNDTLKKLIPAESFRVFDSGTGEQIQGGVRIWNFSDKALVSFTVGGMSTGIRGDVNGDGQVNVLDITALARIILGLDRDEQVIPAGTTKTYELRGNILYDGKAGDAVMTRIPASNADNSTFGWNDGIAWATDYLVPGLPSAILSLTK